MKKKRTPEKPKVKETPLTIYLKLNDLDFENRDNIVKALQSCPSLICAVADQNDSLDLGETVFINDSTVNEF